MDKEFVWDDTLVTEFNNWIPKQPLGGFIDHSSLIPSFKRFKGFDESKEVKKDYEILKCENDCFGIHDYISPEQSKTHCLKEDHPCKIYSIRRLSDNEVFTIGDITGGGNKIINFKLDNDTLKILLQDKFNDDYNWWTNIESLQKKIKVPLFTKEQEEEIINIINRCQYQQTPPNKNER